MSIRAGILSDTHRTCPDHQFRQMAEHCFAGCQVIIHAGDLVETSVLDVFQGRTIYAVHGNMCSRHAQSALPGKLSFQIGPHAFGLTHGENLGPDVENALWNRFPGADCIISGHTHRPQIKNLGGLLFINPGAFLSTGRFGAQGAYAILEIGETLHCSLHTAPTL